MHGDATAYAIDNSAPHVNQLANRAKRWDRLGLRGTGGNVGGAMAGLLSEADVSRLIGDATIAEMEQHSAGAGATGAEDGAGESAGSGATLAAPSSTASVRIRPEYVRGMAVPPTGIRPPQNPPGELYLGCYVMLPFGHEGTDKETFYGGIVAEWSPHTQCHVVEFDDGEVSEHALSQEMHVVIALPHQHGGRRAQLQRLREFRKPHAGRGGAGKPSGRPDVVLEYELYDEREDPSRSCRQGIDSSISLPVLIAEQSHVVSAPMEEEIDASDRALSETSAGVTKCNANNGSRDGVFFVGNGTRYGGPSAADLPGTLGPVPAYTVDRKELDALQQRRIEETPGVGRVGGMGGAGMGMGMGGMVAHRGMASGGDMGGFSASLLPRSAPGGHSQAQAAARLATKQLTVQYGRAGDQACNRSVVV